MDLFSNTETHNLNMPDADVVYYPDFLNSAKATSYFKLLLEQTNWQEDSITIFGKTHLQPRLTALYASNNKSYTYSNITMTPSLFSPELLEIKSKIETLVHASFTTCLLNLYRDGNDSNGWHADDEKELGKNPIIASLSLGEERMFHFKHKHQKDLKKKLVLQHGSLLIMKGISNYCIKKTGVPQLQFIFICYVNCIDLGSLNINGLRQILIN